MNDRSVGLKPDLQHLPMDARLPKLRGLYYGGRWHESAAQKSIPVIAPATGEALGNVVDASADDVALAVESARDAFRAWRDTPAQERAKAVRRAAQILLDNADDLAWLEALDTGNPFQAMRYDVDISVGYMEYFAGLVTEIKGDTIPIGPTTLNYTLREPLGVVGRIGAFNHPLLFTAGTYALRMYLQLRHVTSGNVISEEDPRIRPIPTLLVGAVGGLLVGITSVGSGSLIMVALLLLYPTLSAIKLVGTDLVQAVPLVLSAAISHVLVTGVDWAVLIPLILGGTPGTFLGARLANWVSQSVIRRGIVIVLSLTGLKMLGVSPEAVGLIGAGMLLLGPLVWGFIRQTRGLPAFDNNAAAWRLPDKTQPGKGQRAAAGEAAQRNPSVADRS